MSGGICPGGICPGVFVLIPIGVPHGGMCGRHSYSTSPRSSAHSRDRHREGSFRRSPINHLIPYHKARINNYWSL